MAKLRAKKLPEASVKPRDLTSAVLDKVSKSLFHQALEMAKKNSSIYYPCNANRKIASRNRCLLLVERKIFSGKYQRDPWKYIRDVNRVLNALQNGIGSRSMTAQTAKEEMFSSQMDILMLSHGYCCGSWPILKTRPIMCEGSVQTPRCVIFKEGQKYWRFNRWTYCDVCFNKNIGDAFVPLDSFVRIRKSDFVLHQFVAEKEEPMVKCSSCCRKFHEICELYHTITPGDKVFTCRNCVEAKGTPKTMLRASQLPCTPCDQHVMRFIDKHIAVNPVIVRTLGEIKAKVEVNKHLRGHRKGASEYPYKERKLFAFMDTGEDADICIFAVYYQLFDRECPMPNRNSVYITFIDSAQFLPREIRTKLYNLILLGLFSHWSQLGYEYLYIWSSPPMNGGDYIFYSKPPSMKILDEAGLWNWYCKLVELGVELKVVRECWYLNEFATSRSWKSLDSIPYFEGDACELAMLEVVETSAQMLKNLRAEMSKIEKELGRATGNSEKIKAQRKKLEMHKEFKAKELAEFNMEEKIWELMLDQFDKRKKEFIVVRLKKSSRRERTQDVDCDTIQLNWINDRHLFVDFFWGNMLEFSSVRRAKYSTYVMLHRIFSEIRFCARCKSFSKAGVSDSTICYDCHKNTTRGSSILTSWALQMHKSMAVEPEQVESSSEVESPSQVDIVASDAKGVIEDHHEEAADPLDRLKWNHCLRSRVQSKRGASILRSWAQQMHKSMAVEPEQVESSSEVESPSQVHIVASEAKEVIGDHHKIVIADPPKWNHCLRSRVQSNRRWLRSATKRGKVLFCHVKC